MDILNPVGKGSLVAKIQKVSTKEFQEEAVRLAQSSGKSTAHVARELGVSDSAIYQWQRYCQLSVMMSLFSSRSGEEIRLFGQFYSVF